MKQIVFVATEHSVASTFLGPMDIFQQVGRLYNRIFRIPEAPGFDVKLATVNGKSFEIRSGIRMQPHCSIHDLEHSDLIVIASLGDIKESLVAHKETIGWLHRQHRRCTPIATVCTGSFLLAETGLLDGKTATTHWGFAALFRKMYPKVILKPERLITDEGNLYCSGGFNAGIDLAIYLIEKICGRKTALQCAKTVIHDPGHRDQTPYHMMGVPRGHHDQSIGRIQSWMEQHYAQRISGSALAKQFGMSRRTFERRFKAATGETPLQYLQQVRVEAAKQMLEETDDNFEQITTSVGYEDSSSFRKIFVKRTGLRPKMYQHKFQSRWR